MRAAGIVVGLFLLTAGCFGGGDGGKLDPAIVTPTGPGVVPPTGRLNIDYDNPDNVTFENGTGGIDHHHDLWNGQTRVLIFEQSAKMHPMAARHAAEYVAEATFKPVQGAMVFEGTTSVDFTITKPQRHLCEGEDTIDGDYVCTSNFLGVPGADDPSPPAGLTLRYKHASTFDWIEVGPIAWDTPLPIQVTLPTHTDMPHATSSLWEFQVTSPNKQDSTLLFTAKAEIVRGEGDIPLWPGHPDFYPNGLTSRLVLQRSASAGDAGLYGHGAALVPDDVGPVYADKLISYGTRSLHVWVNITSVTATNPATAPNSWFLFHENATGLDNITNAFDTTNYAFEKRAFYWVLPVDENGMDSPYSDGSRWLFGLGGSLTTPALACYAECANWAATYDITVIATNEALPLDAYHMHCLRDADCPTA